MTSAEEIEHFFQVAKSLTLEAAEIIKNSINELKDVEEKSSDKDLVTKYDKEVERLLFERLSNEFPEHKFIGEETSSSNKETPELTDAPTWIIDPIDGTTNFVHCFPQVCISIGLVINKRLEIGIIYNPCYDEMYTAKRGQGAFLNGKTIQPSSTKELKKSLVNLETSSLFNTSQADIGLARFNAVIKAAHGVRTIGSAALALAFVARGIIDVFHMDGLNSWDVAAGCLIVTEAGGSLIDTKGGNFDFMAPKVIAAANEALAIETSKLILETDLRTQRRRLKKN
ncbi:inositol monophosphatase 2-like [Neodiprion fabricii]|uniref:inositol monophosphatase 2-like n=1 Tax=Neodiprion fabricii TaxID=2872261 RepID=UPI001ED92D52|nr:inositol monophosphatase 2-like [Neodiprion fabricii]